MTAFYYDLKHFHELFDLFTPCMDLLSTLKLLRNFATLLKCAIICLNFTLTNVSNNKSRFNLGAHAVDFFLRFSLHRLHCSRNHLPY